jgi:Cdc6-like AAA superfamily ATPase
MGNAMDTVRNLFAPAEGSRPSELAGRDVILNDAQISFQRSLLGKSSRSQKLLGLRGVGKTMLLNKIEGMAEKTGHVASSIKATESKALN